MAKLYEELTEELISFIEKQKIFFTGTAAKEGTVNISPKGTESLRILNNKQIAWLNLTGSGNETAAHLKVINRITLMFCAFEGDPLILRVYGKARTIHRQDAAWADYYSLFPSNNGARNIFIVEIDRVQTSCGFAVPLMDYTKDRTILTDWSAKKTEAQMTSYWREKNVTSIDGFPTGLFD